MPEVTQSVISGAKIEPKLSGSRLLIFNKYTVLSETSRNEPYLKPAMMKIDNRIHSKVSLRNNCFRIWGGTGFEKHQNMSKKSPVALHLQHPRAQFSSQAGKEQSIRAHGIFLVDGGTVRREPREDPEPVSGTTVGTRKESRRGSTG